MKISLQKSTNSVAVEPGRLPEIQLFNLHCQRQFGRLASPSQHKIKPSCYRISGDGSTVDVWLCNLKNKALWSEKDSLVHFEMGPTVVEGRTELSDIRGDAFGGKHQRSLTWQDFDPINSCSTSVHPFYFLITKSNSTRTFSWKSTPFTAIYSYLLSQLGSSCKTWSTS